MPAADHGITNRASQDEYSEDPLPIQTGSQYRQYEIAIGTTTQAIQHKAAGRNRAMNNAKTVAIGITTKNPGSQDNEWRISSIF